MFARSKGLLFVAFALLVSGCGGQHKSCPTPVASYSSVAAGGADLLQALEVSLTPVSYRPLLSFPLSAWQPSSDAQAAGNASFQFSVSSEYGSALRKVQVDLLVDGDALPYSELRLSWNPALVDSYRLISYETRVAPSTQPGVTFVIELQEKSVDSGSSGSGPESGLLGTLTAWSGQGKLGVQAGPGERVVDPSPYRGYTNGMYHGIDGPGYSAPYGGNCD